MRRFNLALFAAAGIALVASERTRAANVGLQFIEDSIGGVETARAVFSSAPATPAIGVPLSVNPQVWLFDLTATGHATNGGGDWPLFGNNGVVTWVEPEHPGLFNNLYFLDATHWRLESENPIAANPNADGSFGILGNGVSLFAGTDNNNDAVYAAVVENTIPEPASLAIVGAGLAGICLRRGKRI